MKITKHAGKIVINATAEELRKNPKLAEVIRKAQMAPASPAPVDALGDGLGGGIDPAAEAPAPASEGLELPTGADDLGGPDADLGGDKDEQFISAVDKAFTDAYGKPLDEGAKQVLRGLAQMAGGEKSPAVDDLDATDGQIPGGDTDPLAAQPADQGTDPAIPGNPGHGAPTPGSDLMAKTRGQLTRVASGSEFVKKFIKDLQK